MENKNQRWLKELASLFGMDVTRFAECVGYSRQALYLAASGRRKLERKRLELVIFKLNVMNTRLLADEKAKAEENFEARRKLIGSLMDRLSK